MPTGWKGNCNLQAQRVQGRSLDGAFGRIAPAIPPGAGEKSRNTSVVSASEGRRYFASANP